MTEAAKVLKPRAPQKASRAPNSILTPLTEIAARVRNPRNAQRFIIPGVLPRGSAFLFGASGCGKTGIAINIAMSIANGRPWGDLEIEPGSVLYLAAEDRDGVEERLVAAAEEFDLDLPTTSIHVIEATTIPDSEALRRDAAHVAELHGLPIALVIIDTFAAAYGETSQDDANAASIVMHKLDRIARELKCCVLALHHTGKGSNTIMRGSQVFFDRANAVLRAEKRGGTITVDKLKNAPEGATFRYEIAGRDVQTSKGPINVQIVSGIRPLTSEDRATKAERIDRAVRNQGDVALARLQAVAPDGSASIEAWREECYLAWADKSEESRRKAFNRARTDLTNTAKITVTGTTVTLNGTVGTCPANVPVSANDERDNGTGTYPPLRGGVVPSHVPRSADREEKL